jgi:nucleoside diphosphate kinase
MAECSYKVEVTDYVASLKKKYGVTNLRDLQKKLPGQGKQFKLDYLEVTSSDELKNSYRDLFIGKEKAFDNAQKTFNEFIKDRNDVGTKVSRLLDTSSAEIDTTMNIFRKYFDTNIADEKDKLSADEIIESSIALKYILDSMNNEEALADAYNIKLIHIKTKNIDGLSTGLARLYPTIGRAILASKGLVTSGDPRRSSVSAAAVGMAAVKTLADKTGIISINQEGKWIAGSGVISDKENSKRIKRDPIQTGPTVLLNKEFNNAVNPAALSEQALSMLSVLKQTSRLVEPQTEALPVREASAYEASIQDLQSMDKELKDTVSTINSFKFKINPNVKSMLDLLKKDFENAKKKSPKTPISFKKYLEGKFKDVSPSTIKTIFGIDLNKDADGALFRDSNLGVELSQTSPMEGLIENYDNLVDDNPMFFNYFVAVNSRLNVFETVLNFQSDKKFARQVMISDKPTKYSATTIDESYDGMTEKEVLIRRVAVEFKIPVSFITDPESNKDLTELANEFKNFNEATADGIINILTGIAKISDGEVKELDALTGMSPWKIIKLISAIKDIRSNEGDIESTYMAEVDATASGLLIMLLQNAGNTQVQEMLKRLGFKGTKEAIENELRDAYAIAVNELQSKVDIFNSDTSGSKYSVKYNKGLSETSRLLSTLAPLGLNIRELIKMPIMTFIYGQSSKNNQIQFAKDLFELVAKLNNKKQMTEVFEIYGMSSSDVDALISNKTSIEALKAIRETFIDKVSGTTGKFLVESVLEKVYTNPLFGKRNADIETLYELIESNNSLVSINSPYSVLNSKGKLNTAENTDKIPLSKSKEALIKQQVNDQTVTTISKIRASNITSAKVIPIHTIDATVLSRTINRVKKELGRDFNDNEAIMLIHDAAITNSKLASLFSTIYQEELIAVNQGYDIVEELINEYLSKGGSKDKIKDIITRSEENLKSKKEFLKTADIIPYSFMTDLSDSKLPQIKSNETSTKESAVNENAETDVNMTTPFDAEFEKQTPNVKVYSNRDQKDTTKGDKAPVKTTLDTITNKVDRDNEIIEKTEDIQASCEGK